MPQAQMIEAVNNAIGAHGKWKFNLRAAVNTGKSEFTVSNVKVDNLCEFGKWLYSDAIPGFVKEHKPYEVVKRLHGEFHQCAAHVLHLATSGRRGEADQLLEGEYTERSEKLIRALNKWKGELVQGIL